MRLWRAAAALAAAVAGAGAWGATWSATSDDRQVASAYRDTLARAGGRYFTAYQLYDERADRRVGTVFGYQGDTSWVFMTIDPALGPGPFSCTLTLTDGSTVPLGTFTLDRTQSWGRTVDTDLRDVATLRLRDLTTGQTLESEFRR